MKTHRFFSLVVFLALAVIFGWRSEYASADIGTPNRGIGPSVNGQQAAITPIPTDVAALTVSETPESRVLPSVGSNAGLVIGASVLVLIIIGGVLSSRRKQNH